MSKIYDKAFLTGCDKSTEWMLTWFILNYKKHHKTPLIFADFGISELAYQVIRANVHAIIDMTRIREKGWFKKPKAMIHSPSKYTVWIDTDCEILDNCDEIFDLIEPEKLLMAEDKPWSRRRNETWHNSGVVGFVDKPIILKNWAAEVQEKPEVGDQEVLHNMLNGITKIKYIENLPNEYNVLRLQIDTDGYEGKKKIIHWTGFKGKQHIKGLIK